MSNCRALYDRVKQDPNAVVLDVGEEHPFIIHEAHAHVTYKDGTQGEKVIYATFEYVKKHLKKFKSCPCASLPRRRRCLPAQQENHAYG